jgi:hypothetical protein
LKVSIMPLKQHPKFFCPETLSVMEAALDNACEQLMRENHIADVDRVKRKLARTIVALAAVGETNPTKLERMALQAYRSRR